MLLSVKSNSVLSPFFCPHCFLPMYCSAIFFLYCELDYRQILQPIMLFLSSFYTLRSLQKLFHLVQKAFHESTYITAGAGYFTFPVPVWYSSDRSNPFFPPSKKYPKSKPQELQNKFSSTAQASRATVRVDSDFAAVVSHTGDVQFTHYRSML